MPVVIFYPMSKLCSPTILIGLVSTFLYNRGSISRVVETGFIITTKWSDGFPDLLVFGFIGGFVTGSQ